MKPSESIKRLFIYPKLEGLVAPSTGVLEKSLGHDIQDWLEKVLQEHIGSGIKEISIYRVRPWSRVFEVEACDSSKFFLKIPSEEFCLESQITELIRTSDFNHTTKIIAHNLSNGAFLMDALEGEVLRVRVREQSQVLILGEYAAMIGDFQRSIRNDISEFEQLGIPKWTDSNIIKHCKALLHDPRYLAHTKLSREERLEFSSLFPYIQEMLTQLTDFDHGLSIDHGDFQDNNIFVSEELSVIMDWADTSITIPSFTIATYCHSTLLAHPNIRNKFDLIEDILKKYYSNLLGSDYDVLHERHMVFVHLLYPIICMLKSGRLFNLNEKESDTYTSALIDYWIRVVLSFGGAYRDETLSNKTI